MTCVKTIYSRYTCRFPGVSGQPAVVDGTSIPGPADVGSYQPASISTGVGNLPPTAGVRFIETASQRVSLGMKSKNGLPLSAIAISPDSAIHSCTISFSGSASESETYRCAPGSPVVIPWDVDHVWIAQISGIPVMASIDNGAFWDVVFGSGFTSTSDGKAAGWPLRLLFIYGEIPPMSPYRSPYHARMVIESGLTNAGQQFNFCIDGRQRWRMTLTTGKALTGTFGFTISSVKGRIPILNTGEDVFTNDQVIPLGGVITQIGVATGGQAVAFYYDGSAGISVGADASAEVIRGASFCGGPILSLSVATGVGGTASFEVHLDAYDW